MLYILLTLLLFTSELLYFRVADKFNIIDKPNERSSHTQITRRGGGIIFYIAALVFYLVSGLHDTWFMLGLTLVAVVSFIDDIRPLPYLFRMSIHAVSVLIMFLQLNLYQESWYLVFAALILCVAILNAYNFMDGINGITGLYSIVVVIALWFVNNYVQHFADNKMIYITLMSLFVFGFFNFRKKAICFAGDIGALSVAFIILFMMSKLVIVTGDITYLMLMSVYGIDTTLTILHRIKLKQNIMLPHRMHLFQLLANELKLSHLKVSSIYAFLQLSISFGLFLCSDYRWIYSLIVLFMLSVVYYYIVKKYYFLQTRQD